MTPTSTLPRPTKEPRRENFGLVLRSEWTKFRTVRGWVIGLVVAAVLCVAFTFVVANGNHQGGCTGPPAPGSNPNSPGTNCYTGHLFVPTGPDGQAVADSYQFVEQPLTGNGTLTAQVFSLTGLTWNGPANRAPSLAHTQPGLAAWAKAGILLTPNTKQGSPYAAVMATGSNGIRFQYNYTHDQAGQPGVVSAGTPRWLRLTRTRDTITGYASTNGTTWTQIGTSHLAGLTPTVTIGLFVTSPVSFQGSSSGVPTQATAAFDDITLDGHAVSNDWQSRSIGTGSQDYYPTLAAGSYHRSGNALVLSGSGDIAPAVNPLAGGGAASSSLWFGLIVALIVIIVIATMFITTEYRRGLIRTTFTATPARGSVLAAKAVVIGVIAFAAGALAAAVGVPLGEHILNTNGNYIFPAGALTAARIIAGSGVLVAVTAVAVLALGAILRKNATAVAAGIVVFALPYILGQSMSGSAQQWLFRLTPAAGFDVLGTLPHAAQVEYPSTIANGYYPLAPWAGLAVLCAYAVAALALAAFLLRRRDA
jgi:ABC-type transport system involved in multi-copper enzyme maturation permease subunit